MCEYRDLWTRYNPSVSSMVDKFLESKGIDISTLSTEDRIRVVNKLELACNLCPLKYEATRYPIPSALRPESKYLFIGRNPNITEGQYNELFPHGTRQGEIFHKYVEILGVPNNEVSMMNMCNCTSGGNRPVTSEEVDKCSYLTYLALNSLPNLRIIFPLGQDAIRWLLGPNCPGVMQILGETYWTKLNGVSVLIVPLPHPSQCLCDRELGGSVRVILEGVRKII